MRWWASPYDPTRCKGPFSVRLHLQKTNEIPMESNGYQPDREVLYPTPVSGLSMRISERVLTIPPLG
jgi:hypothetical protein